MMRLGSMMVAIAVGLGLSSGSIRAEQDAPRKLVAPVRGEANVEITAPDTKIGKDQVVTTIRVRNVSNGAIAGFRVQENWFDKAGNASAGDSYRHQRPLGQGDAILITLTTPRTMVVGKRNQYQFSHANGTIKTKVVPKIDVPKATTD